MISWNTLWKERMLDVCKIRMCVYASVCASSYLTAVSSQVIGAGGSVLAGVGQTFIHLLLTVTAGVSSLTPAQVCVPDIHTLTGVTAQNGHRHS